MLHWRAADPAARGGRIIHACRAHRPITIALGTAVLLICDGCTSGQHRDPHATVSPARTIVLAPVLNLSGTADFDPLKVTDLLASEFVAADGLSVVPVNLTLAELVRRGQDSVETPEDAIDLARTFGADGTFVVAITEFDPYPPPVVGMVLQYYAAQHHGTMSAFDPVSASRSVTVTPAKLSAAATAGPAWQVQRVFNAADEQLLENIRRFAGDREGQQSPYGWRKYVLTQDLYLRYCGHALIKTMNGLDENDRKASNQTEAES